MTIPGSLYTPTIRKTRTSAFSVDNSMLHNDDDSQYLNRIFGTPTSANKFTISLWFKRGNMGLVSYLLDEGTGGFGFIRINADDTLTYYNEAGGVAIQLITTQLFRDPHSWYHLVIQQDTTQSTSTNRAKMWVNGTQVTSFGTAQYNIAQNNAGTLNTAVAHAIGHSGSNFWDGYLSEYVLCDGQAYSEADFGEYDTNGVWRPIDVSGLTFGNNGFYLPFTTSSSLGYDYSGKTEAGLISQNTESGANEINKGDMDSSGLTLAIKFKALASTAVPQVKIHATSTGFSSATIRIETGSSSAPSGTLVDSNGELTGFSSAGSGLKTITFPNGGPILTAGTEYWLVLAGTGNWGVSHDYSSTDQTMGSLGMRKAAGFDANQSFGHEIYQTGSSWEAKNTPTQSADSPTKNMAVLSPIQSRSSITFSNGNLKRSSGTSSQYSTSLSSQAIPSTGKWAMKFTLDAGSTSGVDAGNQFIGVLTQDFDMDVINSQAYFSGFSNYVSGRMGYGEYVHNGSVSGVTTTYATGDTGEVLVDQDNQTVTFTKNGGNFITRFTGVTTAPTHFAITHYDTNYEATVDFGQNGYTPSNTAFTALSAAGVAESITPAIEDGSAHFQATLYAGNSGSNHVNQAGNSTFQPDFIWNAGRNVGSSKGMVDAVRGVSKYIKSGASSAEETETSASFMQFDADGFTMTGNSSTVHQNTTGRNYVAWQWNGGGSTVSNGNGSITSNVRANQAAGFSIVSYTGTGSNATVGHGLGVAPDMIHIKRREQNESWISYLSTLGGTKHVYLNLNNAETTASNVFNNTAPTTSVFSLGTAGSTNTSSETFIAYCFASIPGYCKAGFFKGNDSTDGPVIETGFSPALVVTKKTSSATGGEWYVVDSSRDTFNPADLELDWRGSNAEDGDQSAVHLDFLSNGFKMRSSGAGSANSSSCTTFFMAWAENPFAGTTPITAR